MITRLARNLHSDFNLELDYPFFIQTVKALVSEKMVINIDYTDIAKKKNHIKFVL